MSRRRKTLSADDRAAWHHVARQVKALPGRQLPEKPDEPAERPAASPAKPAALPKPTERKPRAGPPPLAAQPIEKGLKRRLRRGSDAIDARLDLHGLTQDAAHHRLRDFLHRAQADGLKLVVVITGKGDARGQPIIGASPRHEGYSERGVLRRQVPHWLGLPDLRPFVIGFEEALPTDGGAGALYVRVRARRTGATI